MKAHDVAHALASNLRKEQTDAERRLWALLRAKRFRGVKFRRQRPIGPYIADFCCPQVGLVIEVDGGHHGEQLAADEARTKYFEERGFRVLRFWNSEVLTQTGTVLERISMEIEQGARQ